MCREVKSERNSFLVLYLIARSSIAGSDKFFVIKCLAFKFEKISESVFNDLKDDFEIIYDKTGSIGRRYARNDEIGTPYCITIDGDSVKKKDVTIRERNTGRQIRVKIKDLKETLQSLINATIAFNKAGTPFNF